jgi:cytochrome P450
MEAGRLMRTHAGFFDLYGKTYEEKFFDVRRINTMQAQNFQQITALNFNDYGKANLISTVPMMGKGILFHDGPIWKRSRDMIKPTFARVEISDVESFSYHFDRFLEGIPRDGTTIDLQGPLHNLVHHSSILS